ncbi:IS1595 family transposase [Sulfitobacter sp. S223]|uniref:IS1595 family transposase n=1 Tax=Sulfitobacter sp. S223 TaxID=2867023 RepID=UPI0021A75100|nr:IS1595 family transposase [Sulfitobacter sp. S223]UWR28151.1 IS1595 family transposase [Sulfitobacter sp. S223]
MPSEHHARVFLESIIWAGGRYCPHCGGLRSIKLAGESSRPGLYQCSEAECRGQFTITTKTPLHATKLDLRIWISAMFIVLTSSKGISSVVMARLLGVNQKTAWKMGHAIRELMDDRNGELLPLEDIVEVDEAYVGGAPKSLSGAYNPRGKGTGKPMIFVAASRDGQARARVVADDQRATLEPVLLEWIEPTTTTLMTDGSTSYPGMRKTMASHHRVIHSNDEYANPETGAHVNTAESVISQVQRALVGVYHNLGRQHLQRYLDEIVWRWNHREQVRDVVKQWTTKAGVDREKSTTIWKPIPVLDQMRVLLQGAVGKQMRRSKEYGLCWP